MGKWAAVLVVALAGGCGSPSLMPAATFLPSTALTRAQVSAKFGENEKDPGFRPISVQQDVDEFKSFDADQDSKLNRSEFAFGNYQLNFGKKPTVWKRQDAIKLYDSAFKSLDTDGDGYLSADEFNHKDAT